jgi:hypothetical protein
MFSVGLCPQMTQGPLSGLGLDSTSLAQSKTNRMPRTSKWHPVRRNPTSQNSYSQSLTTPARRTGQPERHAENEEIWSPKGETPKLAHRGTRTTNCGCDHNEVFFLWLSCRWS